VTRHLRRLDPTEAAALCLTWPLDRPGFDTDGVADGARFFLVPGLPADRASVGAQQEVLDLPAGRYLVETFDATTGQRLAIESALGAPLVIGLPSTGGPVMLRVRPAT